jgi:hypothetical protein
MMYPYGNFLIDFDREHGTLRHRNSTGNTRCAIIVETRPTFFLPKVIRNVMYFLGEGWNLHMLGSPECLRHVGESLPGWRFSMIELSRRRRFTIETYNRILSSPKLWSALAEEKVLVFQADSLLTGSNIEDFAQYDYVGAPCGSFDEHYIANGGLSLRSRQTMLECVQRHERRPEEPEDIYFTRAVRHQGGKMPDFNTATLFSVESIYTGHPVGVHGTDKFFHSPEVAERITRAVRY